MTAVLATPSFWSNKKINQNYLQSPYPTVVIEIKDHQNPSQDPLKNERGNSSLFQYVSCQKQASRVLVFQNPSFRGSGLEDRQSRQCSIYCTKQFVVEMTRLPLLTHCRKVASLFTITFKLILPFYFNMSFYSNVLCVLKEKTNKQTYKQTS